MIYKLASLTIGIAFIFLAAWWRDDPDACATLILFAGVLLILGSRHNVVNEWRSE